MITRSAGRFVLHYVEMVAGMMVLYPLWTLATHRADTDSLLRTMEVDTLAMATTMTIAMVGWMRFRGHHWAPALEMSAAMFAGFIVLYPAHWAGALSEESVTIYGHLLMLAFMLLAMLGRRQDYTVGHHDHDHDRPLPAGQSGNRSRRATGPNSLEATPVTLTTDYCGWCRRGR